MLDPNTLSSDGTVALAGTAVSDDGKLMAYAIATSGSDWTEWHVRDVDTGKDLSDDLKWVKFSGASWSKDNKGFYYSRYDEPKGATMRDTNYFQKLYYHRLGTPQSEDKLIYERPDNKEMGFRGERQRRRSLSDHSPSRKTLRPRIASTTKISRSRIPRS